MYNYIKLNNIIKGENNESTRKNSSKKTSKY